MPQRDLKPGEFRTSELSTRKPTRFELAPPAEERARIAEELGLEGLRKLRLAGEIAPRGARGWRLRADLGATVVQSCVVTLEPVTTRIDETVERNFLPAELLDAPEAGSEVEMPEDTTTEPLGSVLSAHEVMVEALALALPQYPRAPDAGLGSVTHAEPGVTPLGDEDVKPFAALAGLRDKLDGKS